MKPIKQIPCVPWEASGIRQQLQGYVCTCCGQTVIRSCNGKVEETPRLPLWTVVPGRGKNVLEVFDAKPHGNYKRLAAVHRIDKDGIHPLRCA